MHSALLSDGKVITAKVYDEKLHGVRIYCMDKSCGVPLIYIPESDGVTAHFKSSGRGDSIHKENCGFAKKLTFQQTVAKVSEYQASLREQGIREFVVRLNLNSIDPDYEAKEIYREPSEKDDKDKPELDEKVLKESKPTPSSIGSLKAVKKLFTTVEPDLLASILVSVKGTKIPISELIRSNHDAHLALWDNKTIINSPYFIHGQIDKVIRREKVWYIKFFAQETSFFSLVIFEKHFEHFTLKDEDLIGKHVLAYGYLKKNEFNKDKPATEMIIKSNKYLEML